MATKDHFDLINADNDYMDEEIERKVSSANLFFTDLENMRETNDSGGIAPGMERSIGFNEVIEDLYDDKPSDKAGEGGYAQAAKMRKQKQAEEDKDQE